MRRLSDKELLQEIERSCPVAELPRRAALCRKALSRTSLRKDRKLWATLQAELANSLLLSPGCDQRAEEQAIAAYRRALKGWPREEPEERAEVEVDLAIAYSDRRSGDPEENIQKGLGCIRRALRLLEPGTSALLRSRALSARGDLLALRRASASLAYLNQAISAYQQALTIQSPETALRDWVSTMLGLGNALRARSRWGRAEDLEEAILTYRRLLEACDPADPNWAATQMNLGAALHERQRGDPAENLAQAVAAYRKVLSVRLRSEDPREWARARVKLANALVSQHQNGSGQRLEEAFEIYRDALAAVSPLEAPVEVATAQCNLATALSLRGDRASREEAVQSMHRAIAILSRRREPETWAHAQRLLGNLLSERNGEDRADDLEEAIAAYRRALRFWRRDTDTHEWAETTIDLARALLDRILGDPVRNVERAILCLRNVLDVATPSSLKTEWVDAMLLLGEGLMKGGVGGRQPDFEEAIRCFRRVVQAQSAEAEPEDLAVTFLALADAFSDRPRGNRARNMEAAVSFSRRAVDVLSPTASAILWAVSQQKLGGCLQDRLWGGRSANLKEAMDCYRSALGALPAGQASYERALILNDLGNALVAQVREDRSGSHEQAIEVYEQALEILPQDLNPEERARTLTSLGVAYSERLLEEPQKNLERAIAAFKDALSIWRAGRKTDDWANTMLNLGTAYQDPRGRDRARGIELAMEIYRRILRVMKREVHPLAWAEATLNLGTAYSDRVLGDRAGNLEEAISAYRRALTVMTRERYPLDWALVHFNMGEAYESRVLGRKESNVRKAIEAYRAALKVHDPQAFPIESRRTACSLGELCLRTGRWHMAASAFRIALRANEALYRSSFLASSREVELSAFPELHRHAAQALARIGRAREALTVLERGRAREVGEALARDRADIEAVGRKDSSLYRRYLQAARQLRQVAVKERAGRASWREMATQRGLEPLRAEARQARARLDDVVAEIRRLPGHGDFLRPIDFRQIAASVVETGGCLAYLNVSTIGAQILILRRSSAGHAELIVHWDEGVDARALGGLLAEQRSQASPKVWSAPVLRVLGSLVLPLAAEARRLGLDRVWLIPCGPLSLFPLHAARGRMETDEISLLDAIEVAYVPSARLFAIAQEALRSLRSGAWRLLGVGNPELPGEAPLPFAGGELSFISRLFPVDHRCLLFGRAAGREAVLRGLPGATHLHLACHGRFFERDPFASCLLLARGEVLSAHDIVSDGPLAYTRLAVLSACQSGRADIDRLPDEAIGLPAVFLQAGIPGVVGTLWPVNDLSTALLMIRFYELHFREDGEGPLPPVRALRKAQLWLRDVQAGELLALFEEQRRLSKLGEPAVDALAIAAGLSRFALEAPESRPFADPYYWAPFIFVGV